MSKLGRILSEEECEWLNIRGLHKGWDTDVCDPQHNHIVAVYDSDFSQVECLCGSKTLWGHAGDWGHPRASGTLVEEDKRLSCTGCLHKFETLFEASKRRTTHGPISGNLPFLEINKDLERYVDLCRSVGRYDLGMLLDSVRISLLCETGISEQTLRHLMGKILALKNARIAKAMDLLIESDGV